MTQDVVLPWVGHVQSVPILLCTLESESTVGINRVPTSYPDFSTFFPFSTDFLKYTFEYNLNHFSVNNRRIILIVTER